MRLLFWISALTIGYVYVGYPALLVVWAKLKQRHCGLRNADCGTNLQSNPQSAIRNPQCLEPAVSIVIAARNEAPRLPARIENLLALDYPADRRQIIVVSDGSTDDTLSVLSRYRDVVDIVDAPQRGKSAALNAGVARAVHDLLVFADARQMFAPDAVRALVAPFADPAIGGVTGELLLDCEASEVAGRRAGTERRRALGDRRSREGRGPGRRTNDDRRGRLASTIADGVGLYWRYEKQLRRLESAVGSTLGATGAIYAMRRSLYRALPDDTILDDVLAPMRVVLAASSPRTTAGAAWEGRCAPARRRVCASCSTASTNTGVAGTSSPHGRTNAVMNRRFRSSRACAFCITPASCSRCEGTSGAVCSNPPSTFSR